MAFQAGVITASLNLITTGFSTALNASISQLRNAGQQMSNAFGPNSQNNINNTANAANRLADSFKDVNRIVSGIIISQVFYQGMQSIESAVTSLLKFSNQMQVAQVSMEYFLGTAEAAKEYVEVMQDFAATTPFSTGQSIDLSRKLMAMGFEAKSMLSVMQILVDSTAAAGGTGDELNRIVIALGQINTQGYLAGQELRQLANANIPIYKILQEELGLTGDQMKEIGKLKIPAETGIAAILKGLQRYEGAAKRLSEETMTGMLANIGDNLLIIGKQATEAPYAMLNSFTRKIYETLEEARDIITAKGLGGVFERFIPPQLQTAIRATIAGIKSMGQSLGMLYQAFQPVIQSVGGVFIRAFGVAIPLLANFVRQVSVVISGVLQASPAIRMLATAIVTLLVANTAAKGLMFLWSVTRMGAICAYVARTVTMLSSAIRVLTLVMAKNPIIGLLMVLAGALISVAMSSKTASAWLDGVMSRLSKLAGFSVGDQLIPTDGTDLDEAKDKYNEMYQGMKDNLSDIGKELENNGKEADKAGKKVEDKFVASFDELYQIPDKLDDLADGLGNLGNAGMPDMDLDFDIGDTKLPEVSLPGLSGGDADDTIGPWFRNIKKWFTDFEWPSLPSFPVVSFEVPLNAIKIFLEQAKLGVINFGNAFNAALQGMADAANIFAEGALTGFNIAISGATGLVNALQNALTGIGTTLGNAAGALGDFAKNAGEAFTKMYVDIIGSVTSWTTSIVDLIGTSTAIAATRIADFVGDLNAGFDQLRVDVIQSVTEWTNRLVDVIGDSTLTAGTTIATWVTTTATAFETWRKGIQTTFETWRSNVKTTVSTWATELGTTFTTWSATASTTFATWAAAIGTVFSGWRTNINGTVSSWVADFTSTIGKWKTSTTTTFSAWKTGIESLFTEWSTAIGTSVSNWAQSTYKSVHTWANNVGTVVAGTLGQTNKLFGEFITATGTSWAAFLNGTSKWASEWGNSIGSVFAQVANATSAAMNALGSNGWESLSAFFKGAADGVTEWARGFVRTVADGAKAAWSWLKNLASAAGQALGGFADNIDSSIKSATVSMGAWYDRNKQWAVPAAIGVGVVGGAIALAPFTGGWSLAGLLALETGGIVDQDQLVRIGEGNKREAVIPLENSAYMKPFSRAVANDLASMMGEQVSYGGNGGADMRPIVYVHNMIADERGLKELYRKLNIIEIQEEQRKGRGR
ncbi:hypothetical protein D3C75_158470 [compost metagenome]